MMESRTWIEPNYHNHRQRDAATHRTLRRLAGWIAVAATLMAAGDAPVLGQAPSADGAVATAITETATDPGPGAVAPPETPIEHEQPEPTVSPRGSGLPDFPPRLADDADFEAALEAIRQRREEVQAALDLVQAGPAAPEAYATHTRRLEVLDDLKLILQRYRTQQSRLEESSKAVDEQEAQREAFEAEATTLSGPVPLAELDELRIERRLQRRERNAVDISLDALAQQIKAAEAEVEAAQKARREARLGQEQAAEGTNPEASAEFELARLSEIIATYRLEALRTQRAAAEQERRLIEARLELLERRIEQMDPRVSFSAEALEEKRKEIQAHRATLEEELEQLQRERDLREGKLYDARDALRQVNGENGRRAVLADQAAAEEAWLEAASRGIEYLEKQLEYDAVRERLWERRYALTEGAEDVDAGAWLRQTRETIAALEQDRDIIEARMNVLRKAQLDLKNRLANPDLVNGDADAIRERLEALDVQEDRGSEILAGITQVESLASRLEQQLDEVARVRDLDQLWARIEEGVSAVWAHELFVMDDEVDVDGEVVIEERGFTVGRTVIGVAAFAGVFLLGWMFRGMLRRLVLPGLVGDAQHPRDLSRDVVVALIRNTSTLFLLVIALWSASRTLPWRGVLHEVLGGAMTVAIWCQIGLWGNAVLGRVLQRNRLRREEADPASLSAYGLLGFFGRVAIWAIVLLTILWALDYQIAPLIGALGVGGIAVAFALQSILADIFNSMAIILDKPFRVSDFIIVGDTLGTVEQIGIKTTRIRSLSGEQIIMTNSDLLGSRIRNYKRMLERRVLFRLGVVYHTPADKLERIPVLIREVIEGMQRTRFDRAHFFEYGDFSLNYEVVYYVSGSDYNLYMDIQQAINLALFRRFEAEGIEFAYPTQSIIVQRSAPSSAFGLQPAHDAHG